MLDPIADKLLVGAALMMLVGQNRLSALGLYPAIVIMLREILVSGLREYLAGIRIGLPVTRLAKWKTGFQMGALGTLSGRQHRCRLAASEFPAGVADWRDDAVGRRRPDPDHRLGLSDRRVAACRDTGDTRTLRRRMKVLGIVGWSGSGKTTLLDGDLPAA